MQKIAEATAVPFADSATDTAAASPIPGLAVGNKPAPGLKGPKGLAPRTNYSRVNTGSPTPVDAGASSQKNAPADIQSFLPPKIAQREVSMITPRITIHEMVKAAAQAASDHAAVSLEAERQLVHHGVPVKVASVAADPESIPTTYVEKLAGACEYLSEYLAKEAADIGPGTGPNPMQVLEAKSERNEFESGHQGEATSAHVVPKNPGTHKPSETPAGPSNALDDNMNEAVSGTQKVSGITADDLRKAASLADVGKKARGAAIEAGGYLRGAAKDTKKAVGAVIAKAKPAGAAAAKDTSEHLARNKGKYMVGGGLAAAGGAGAAYGMSRKKEAAAVDSQKQASAALDPRLLDYFLQMTKSAEDAINPAQISAGAAVAPDTSSAGESGGAPAGGQPEGPTGLVGSNEAAINYTRGQAKAPMKSQLAAVLTEPALSAAHDSTLDKAFDNTGKAGVKISHSLRSSAARAVLEKMAEEACATATTKKKVSAGMSNFQAPPVSGAAAGPM
jgi:hypothetical protein